RRRCGSRGLMERPERPVERRPVERVRGTQDLWPGEALPLDTVRRGLELAFARAGYRRVDVPVLEPAELHLRKSGLEIISKLYAFDDLGGRRLCLRPELTASLVRAFVSQPAPRLPAKVYSGGPVFRYERPSKGRYRQFTQTGVELVGASGPLADAEVIALAVDALEGLGLAGYRVTVGHVGILAELLAKLGLPGRLRGQLMETLEPARRHGLAAARAQLRELDPDLFDVAGHFEVAGHLDVAGADGVSVDGTLAPVPEPGPTGGTGGAPGDGSPRVRQAASGLLGQLGAESLGRRTAGEVLERLVRKQQPGPLRLAVERALRFIEELSTIHGSPGSALDHGRRMVQAHGLDPAHLESLEQTVRLAEDFGTPLDRLEIDLGLSRGLQYYTGMVFEIDHGDLGSESQLCGGGRYDDLFRALGARQAIPALGFAFGVERVRLALEAEKLLLPEPAQADVLVVPATPEQAGYAGRVARHLRASGRRADLDVTGRPVRQALAYANREGYPKVAIVGHENVQAQTVRLREMTGGQERTMLLAELAAEGAP
ncbi:MAG TPA: HisS family protein, partial [Chloroflexota bacterium]|nr:HisS family protein [Chloroflexota bacterium]